MLPTYGILRSNSNQRPSADCSSPVSPWRPIPEQCPYTNEMHRMDDIRLAFHTNHHPSYWCWRCHDHTRSGVPTSLRWSTRYRPGDTSSLSWEGSHPRWWSSSPHLPDHVDDRRQTRSPGIFKVQRVNGGTSSACQALADGVFPRVTSATRHSHVGHYQ